MLDPRERTVLLEALRPPEGAELDAAVGTTFSLDLMALLTAPLAFTMFDREDADGRPTSDPLVLLETLHRFAGRITVFCQAGRIAVPPEHRPLFGYLERSVVEVAAPAEGGVFHPKVWLLRFVEAGGGVRYRLLCLSRNLTFDPSWDTVLALDGELVAERTNAFSVNRPLSDFVAALPGLAVRPLGEGVRERADLLADEVLRVQWELPDWAREVRFWPLGISGHRRWPFPDGDGRLMVVSPFLSGGALERLTEGRAGCVLVSREQALEEMPAGVLERFERVSSLSGDAEPDEVAEEDAADAGETLRGLHAKLYVTEEKDRARVWTGSANATEAAFARNVEFLVELGGWRKKCGIEAVLGAGETSLEHLLVPFVAGEDGPPPESEEQRLQRVADDARMALATAPLRLRAARAAGEEETYDLELVADGGGAPALPAECAVRCRPVMLGEARWAAVEVGGEALSRFERVSWQAVGPFVAFEVTASSEGGKAVVRFVLSLPIDGGPEDRADRLVELVLCDRRAVLRFLLMLLAEDAGELAAIDGIVSGSAGHGEDADAGGLEIPLLESLMRTLEREPERLDRIARLVADLRRSERGAELLPEEFDAVWEPIWQARREAGRDPR